MSDVNNESSGEDHTPSESSTSEERKRRSIVMQGNRLLRTIVLPMLYAMKREIGTQAFLNVVEKYTEDYGRAEVHLKFESDGIYSEIIFACTGRPMIEVTRNICTKRFEFIKSYDMVNFGDVDEQFVRDQLRQFLLLAMDAQIPDQ